MHALFAGGPLHGQRHHIAPDGTELPWTYMVAKPMPPLSVADFLDTEPRFSDHITYHLRKFRDLDAQGTTRPLYVNLSDHTLYGQVRDQDGRLADHLLVQFAPDAIPKCFAPDCTGNAPTRFTALEHGRLGGKTVEFDQEIRLCPRHAHDIYIAAYARGRDQLPEWMRNDDNLDTLDVYDVAHAWHDDADKMIAARARALRMSQS